MARLTDPTQVHLSSIAAAGRISHAQSANRDGLKVTAVRHSSSVEGQGRATARQQHGC